jgi:hypothetical protein
MPKPTRPSSPSAAARLPSKAPTQRPNGYCPRNLQRFAPTSLTVRDSFPAAHAAAGLSLSRPSTGLTRRHVARPRATGSMWYGSFNTIGSIALAGPEIHCNPNIGP